MSEGTTIVHAAEGAAGEITEPIVDLAHEAGETAAHVEHHGEQLAEHAEQLGEQDDKWQNLSSRVEHLESRILEIPAEVGATVTSTLETFKSDVTEMVRQSTQTAENTVSGETEPPPKAENKAEKPSFLGGVRNALHRLL